MAYMLILLIPVNQLKKCVKKCLQRSAGIFISLPNILSMDKLNSTVERYLRSPTLPDFFARLTDEKEGKECSSSDDTIIEALGMAEGLAEKVDLILAKLSKLDKLDDIELCLNNLSTSVSARTDSVFRNLQQKRELKICRHSRKDYYR